MHGNGWKVVWSARSKTPAFKRPLCSHSRAAASARSTTLVQDGLRDSEPVVGRSASAKLVEDDQRAGGGG